MLKSWFEDPEKKRRMVDSYEDHKSGLITNARSLYANLPARIRERNANRA
jgi:hypothetical protein